MNTTVLISLMGVTAVCVTEDSNFVGTGEHVKVLIMSRELRFFVSMCENRLNWNLGAFYDLFLFRFLWLSQLI